MTRSMLVILFAATLSVGCSSNSTRRAVTLPSLPEDITTALPSINPLVWATAAKASKMTWIIGSQREEWAFHYDASQRLSGVEWDRNSDVLVDESWTYSRDGEGKVLKVEHDIDGNLIHDEYWNYVYTESLLTAISWAGPYGATTWAFEYSSGRLSVAGTANNPTRWLYTYDDAGRLVQLVHDRESWAYSYTGDSAQLAAVSGDGIGPLVYSYADDRLSSVVGPKDRWSYEYDEAGRLLTINHAGDDKDETATFSY